METQGIIWEKQELKDQVGTEKDLGRSNELENVSSKTLEAKGRIWSIISQSN